LLLAYNVLGGFLGFFVLEKLLPQSFCILLLLCAFLESLFLTEFYVPGGRWQAGRQAGHQNRTLQSRVEQNAEGAACPPKENDKIM